MKSLRLTLVGLLVALFATSCHEKTRDHTITLDSLAAFRTEAYVLDTAAIGHRLERLAYADKGTSAADARTRNYYLAHGQRLWVSRLGVCSEADSVLHYAEQTSDWGFNRERFCYTAIKNDLERARTLDFDDSDNTINAVFARLEYHLTKAYLNYTAGQRFGYTDPRKIYNRIEVRDSDSVRVTYNALFDIPMQRADKHFFATALRKVGHDSAAVFLRESHPEDAFYDTLQHRLARTQSQHERTLLLVNMERCRWRLTDYPWRHNKYVLVNLASQHLEAVCGDSVTTMRIGVGSPKTKTPMLTSAIKRIDLNPQWIIPRSIIKQSVSRHAGDSAYFARHNYFIRNRKTGKDVSPRHATQAMLESADYLVIQRGGAGNALGRIIFRFDNNFSVYLHDTSNPSVFASSDRSVSHGCVRVERPLDLAVFLLEDKDDGLIDRLRYSATFYDNPDKLSLDELEGTKDRERYLANLPLSPTVPLFITYFTLYPDRKGRVRTFPDIYGYDAILFDSLKPYL